LSCKFKAGGIERHADKAKPAHLDFGGLDQPLVEDMVDRARDDRVRNGSSAANSLDEAADRLWL
jgi:hypothetical protein